MPAQRPIRLQAIAEALRRNVTARIARGDCSQGSLSRRTGISQPHISHLLAGRRSLTIPIADTIMTALQIPTEELLIDAIAHAQPPTPTDWIRRDTLGRRITTPATS